MARHNRRRDRLNEVARQPPRSDAPLRRATSRPWGDLASVVRPSTPRPASVVYQTNRIRQTLLAAYSRRVADSLRKPPNRAPGAVSFGSWRLPPFSRLAQPPEPIRAASVCARRSIRREVLFALRRRGAGSGARKKHFSNTRC